MNKLIILLLIFLPFSICGQDHLEDWKLYTNALEAIIQKNETQAVELLEKLIADYPDSLLIPKAKQILAELINKIDHSGIVSFYASQLISSLYVFLSLPNLTGYSDNLTLGLLGLCGVGVGIGSAYYTSLDSQLTLAHELWVEGSLSLLLTNYVLCANAINSTIPDFSFSKTSLSIQLGLITAQRVASYFWIKNNPYPSYGKPALSMWGYFWGHYYSWLSYLAFTNLQIDSDLAIWISLGISNAAAITAFLLWDSYPISLERSGLISLSGIGGAGIGIFGCLVSSTIFPTTNLRIVTLITMLSSIAGKTIGYFLTQEMPLEKKVVRAKNDSLSVDFLPIIHNNNFGIACKIDY